jgi:hypothetical protein
MAASAPKPAVEQPHDPNTRDVMRGNVRDLLLSSEAYKRLSPEKQRDVAYNMVRIAEYLAAPEGIPANMLPNGVGQPPAAPRSASVRKADPYAFALDDNTPQEVKDYQTNKAAVDDIRKSKFSAQAAHEGAAVAGVLLR